VTDAARELLAEFGGLDILVNNAGISGPTAPMTEYDDEEWDRIININLTSVYRLCKLFVPGMVSRKSGRVINIASSAALRGMPNSAAYSASKAAILGLSMGLAKEVGAFGVTVNCVAPAAIETEMLHAMGIGNTLVRDTTAKTAVKRLGSAREVAATVGWIASPACSFTTGAVFDLTGGRLIN
jgi:2-dehydro-3-deoxy-L-rhamnonate dehydrogenase (NAD+)